MRADTRVDKTVVGSDSMKDSPKVSTSVVMWDAETVALKVVMSASKMVEMMVSKLAAMTAGK
jgi:hypothetical protein